MMHRIVSALFAGAFGLALTCSLALAQTNPDRPAQDEKKGSANRSAKMVGENHTVTGCLTQDPKEKNEYMITGEDGKTWGLKSKSVKLAPHLNHKVSVTGKVTKEEHENEAGDMDVSTLNMISETCK